METKFNNEKEERIGERFPKEKYEYYGEIQRCDLCTGWIEFRMYQKEIKGQTFYFHPMCFRILNGKKHIN
jgi:hypothetical protein